MEYAAYRARGLHIGSGSVESGCKQVVRARLKGAGMIWDASGAEEVAVVRAWLKSGRWDEAMALRAAPGRSYRRQRERARGEEREAGSSGEGEREVAPETASAHGQPRGGLPPDVLARVRAEAEQEQGTHPWRKAWSVKQQREHHAEQMRRAGTARAA